MRYNFDEIVPRRGTHSVKWDSSEDSETLPMWIADMDFRTFPDVASALSESASKGYFGYNRIPAEFYDSIISWWQKQHHYNLDRSTILPATGVVAGLSAAIRALCIAGDEVIVQTPTYNHFFNMIEGCGCKLVENQLAYRDGAYYFDAEDFELNAASARAKVLLLGNPQNPVGKVWTAEELETVARICKQHGITVLSDEIHSDLVYPDFKHIPFVQIAEKHDLAAISCTSASKTFNLSGLQAAYLLTNDELLHQKVEKQLWAQASANPGLLAVEALVVAYTQGDEWLAQLKEYLLENYWLLQQFASQHFPDVKVTQLQATYLVWLDCSARGCSSQDISAKLLKEHRLWVNPGDMYGKGGEGFLRINIACPREVLIEGLKRLKGVLS